VHAIFKAKCNDCHAADMKKPKGKFGFVMDFKRLAQTPKYLVPGDADKSEIFRTIDEDEMPPEDSKFAALTKAEKATVRKWIEIGAPCEVPGVAPTVAAPVEEVATRAPLPLWNRVLRYLGRFHPVSTHIPVALMMVAVLAEALAWWTRRAAWLETVRFLVIVAALGGVGAAVLGWLNAMSAAHIGQEATVLFFHRWLGTFTAVWTVICAGLVMCHECREGSFERARFRGALLFGAALVGVTGFLGSALIYGLDHYSWN
jgi:uncharacterized membrane protein